MVAWSWKGAIVISCCNEWSTVASCGAPKSLHFEPWWPSRATHIGGTYICICTRDPLHIFLQCDNSFILRAAAYPCSTQTQHELYCTQSQIPFLSCALHESLRLLASVKSVHIVERIIKKYVSITMTIDIVKIFPKSVKNSQKSNLKININQRKCNN